MNIARTRSFGMIIAGVGLIMLGTAFLLSNKQATDAKQPTDFSAIPARTEYKAPDLLLYDLHEIQHKLSDYQGKVVLVNLWATWCPPCKAEMPILQAFYAKYQGESFTVVAIDDGESAADVDAFVQTYRLTFSIWLDPTYQATDQVFKTMNLPSSYVINRSGIMKLAWFGAISRENLEKYVTPIIMEK